MWAASIYLQPETRTSSQSPPPAEDFAPRAGKWGKPEWGKLCGFSRARRTRLLTTRNLQQVAEAPPTEEIAPVAQGKGEGAGEAGVEVAPVVQGKGGKKGKVVRDLTKKDKFFGLTPTQPVGLLGSQLILRSIITEI